MKSEMIKFPSIEQWWQVLPSIIRDAQFTHIDPETKSPVYDESAVLPVLRFRGTAKLHGTNAAIVQTISEGEGESIHFQSRNRILTVDSDLVGFCAHMAGYTNEIKAIFHQILGVLKDSGSEDVKHLRAIAIFGEWCGEGIQKGVAISQLPKMFVIFGVRAIHRGEIPAVWLDLCLLPLPTDIWARIFNIMQFSTYSLLIDFNQEESVAKGKQKMTELTDAVEAQCPVGEYFRVSGVGEGIVWQAIPSPNSSVFLSSRYSDSRFWFKVKGEKHTMVGKAKSGVKPEMDPETASKMDAFLEVVLTPGRLQQGLQVLERELQLPLEAKSVGAFIRWVKADVTKEEYDRIAEAGLNEKDIFTPVSAAARRWYLEQLNA